MSRKINIGVITKYTTDSYFGTLLKGVYQVVKQHNANLFVVNSFMVYRFNPLSSGRDSIYYSLACNHIDGWIVFPQGASKEYIEAIHTSKKPMVLISSQHGNLKYTKIMEDNLFGAETVTQHLIDHGHKKIAFIGWLGVYDMAERFEGYKNTLLRNGIAIEQDLIIQTEGTLPHEANRAIQKAIKDGLTFTGVFAANDYLALGTMEALKEKGFRIPQDVAVIGYDNILQCKKSSPGLTSMNQNVLDKGIAAAENLIKIIKGDSSLQQSIYIRSDIVIRKSCGCEPQIDEEEELTKENLEIKASIIKTLEDSQEKFFDVGTNILSTSISDIKKQLFDILNTYSWGCLGFWEENSSHEKELYIHKVIDLKTKKEFFANMLCPTEDFPPKDFLPDTKSIDTDDFVWILPISSSSQDWGIIAYIGPFNKASGLFAYDPSLILFNLLGTAMDRELANSELKKTLQTLQQTQEQLIQSEKMVSLGGLVAGVAHEVNTPIGVSITAASYLEERSRELKELFESGKLKRSDMEKYIETSTDTIKILMLNLQRASNLISSFKQIAVDQSVEEKRNFNIKEYVNEVLLSLNPKLKKTKHVVSVQCPDDLEIYSYPGALSQIITNLVVNSLVHAFDEDDEGNISINIYTDSDVVNIIYSDDGKGIDNGDLGKIFDPFFTTKRGQGGTGLGLNIVYNIVTQEYGGNIKCISEPGKGTTFIIKFPLREV